MTAVRISPSDPDTVRGAGWLACREAGSGWWHFHRENDAFMFEVYGMPSAPHVFAEYAAHFALEGPVR